MICALFLWVGWKGQNVSASSETEATVLTRMEEDHEYPMLESWQENYFYMAPSTNGKGWGVFAAKAFQKGDVVEVSPMWVSFENHDLVVEGTILNNYISDLWESDGTTSTALLFGYSHMFNHGHKNKQNIRLTQFGDGMDMAFGISAKRDIAPGEELLSNYGSDWFTTRGLHLVVDKEEHPLDDEEAHSSNTATKLTPRIEDAEWREMYTSKIFAGHGGHNYQALTNSEDTAYDMEAYIRNRVGPQEAGYRNARAKVPIREAGTLLEILPALLVDKEMVVGTLLEPIVLFWNDLESSSVLDHGPEMVHFFHPSSETEWAREEYVLDRFEETVLLTIGGNLALLERTVSDDPDDYNCRLDGIVPDSSNKNAFTIRIVATKPIEVGERLVLKMAGMSASLEARHELWNLLVETGQPLTPSPESEEEEEEDEDEYEYEYEEGEEYDIDHLSTKQSLLPPAFSNATGVGPSMLWAPSLLTPYDVSQGNTVKEPRAVDSVS
jgi:uncharacterized protein